MTSAQIDRRLQQVESEISAELVKMDMIDERLDALEEEKLELERAYAAALADEEG